MPEARDRLPNREDAIEGYSPFMWRRIPLVGPHGTRAAAAGMGGIGGLRIEGITAFTGPENLSAAGRGRGSRGPGSLLPSWYPRVPLRDVTALIKAIERRRERERSGEDQERELQRSGERQGRQGLTLQDQTVLHNSPTSTPGARLEHNIFLISPSSKIRFQSSIGKVPKILLNMAHCGSGEDDSEHMTPQKKLLNNIDQVEKVVMEELRKLKRTPTAMKAEREKRVRTLMSMR